MAPLCSHFRVVPEPEKALQKWDDWNSLPLLILATAFKRRVRGCFNSASNSFEIDATFGIVVDVESLTIMVVEEQFLRSVLCNFTEC